MELFGCWILLACFILSFIGNAKADCASDEILCRSGSQCVKLAKVCRNDGNDCLDRSDEDPTICSVWTSVKGNCMDGKIYYDDSSTYDRYQYDRQYSDSCHGIKHFCDNGYQSSLPRGSRICEFVKNGILGDPDLHEEETGMALTEELVDLMQQSVNITSQSISPCPMFYTQVGKTCLSLFSAAKIPWAEARQFCLSIGGDLVRIGEKITQTQLLQYMSSSRLTSNYWIGGRYDMDSDSWSWVSDDMPMPLGSPYWATRFNTSCIPRHPVHMDPFSAPPPAVPGALCYHYTQAPINRNPGWCAAMTQEFFYYYTDELCTDSKSPLCIYSGDAYTEKATS